MRDSHNIDSRLLVVWTTAVCVFITAPLLCILAVSFTPANFISFPKNGLSLRWYEQLLHHKVFLEAGLNSLLLACEAAATALVLGVLAALAVVRYRFALRETVRNILTAPLLVPMVMSGLAVLIFFSSMGWGSQPFRLYAAHCALTLPYVMRVVTASLTGFDMNQELAARNLGASPLKAFLLVTLPQLVPGLLAGGVFAFIVSFDNVGLSIFLAGASYKTLPVELFSYVANETDPMAAALSVVMIVISLAVVLVVERVVGLQKLMRA